MKRLVVLYQQHDHTQKKNLIIISKWVEVIIESNENLVGNLTLNIHSLHNCSIYNIESLWTFTDSVFKKKDAAAS
jgi:hypothetical protein